MSRRSSQFCHTDQKRECARVFTSGDKCDNSFLYNIHIYHKTREKRPRRRIYARIGKNVAFVTLSQGAKCEREKLKNGCESRLRIWEAGRSNLRAPEMMACPTG
nr:MAG TPA: hypothetical protein [Caudoviricetes sp.]